MKKQIKRLLELTAPELIDAYRAINNRRLFGFKFWRLHRHVKMRLFQNRSIEVLTGPFMGMKY